MRVKEKVIRQSISEAESEIAKIDAILNATPLSDLIKLEIETLSKAKSMDTGSREVLKYLDAQIGKRNDLRKLAEKQMGSIQLVERKAHLSFELGQLKNELYWIENKGH